MMVTSAAAAKEYSFPEEQEGVPDNPIDVSIPYRPREAGAARHFGFFPYPAKKPWQVVQEYIKHYSRPGDLVCDPFSGSGVTPVEALVLGRRAVASDINPVARFITRMTAIAPIDIARLQVAYERVSAAAQVRIEELTAMSDEDVLRLLSHLDYPRAPIPSGVRRAGAETVDGLHTVRQLAGLAMLRDAIRQTDDEALRDLLMVAFGNTVRYANRTYAGRGAAGGSPYRGNANFLRRFSFSLASGKLFHEHLVWPTFERTFASVRKAKEETNLLIGRHYNEAMLSLASVPASGIHEVTGAEAVDYCFTDPPYSNEIKFLDLSVLWAAWLDFEITDEARDAELLIGGARAKRPEQFRREFADSIRSVAIALKDQRWFTLVYKDRNLGLWQSIVDACESNGLRYVNAVWQNVGIRSTRQVENPNISPQGDMYLNFRKMAPDRFFTIYGRTPVQAVPTPTNYLASEVERIIVAYLDADIGFITSNVIRQTLDSGVFRDYREHPELIQADLQHVLRPPKFVTWQTSTGHVLWAILPEARLDPLLDTIDRARYYVFSWLRAHGTATEGEVNRHLLTRFSQEGGDAHLPYDVRALLRSVGTEIDPRRWAFAPERVTEYRQLRLLFRPSLADELRERLEQRHRQRQGRQLRVDLEGLNLVTDRLRQANTTNRHFDSQLSEVLDLLQTVLTRLRSGFEGLVECVVGVGDWAREGIDLRNLPFQEITFGIVLRTAERTFDRYMEIAQQVFTDLRDESILAQFRLYSLTEWQRATSLAQADGAEETLGVPLLTRQ